MPKEMRSSILHRESSQLDSDLGSNCSQGESDSEATSSVHGSTTSGTSSLDQDKGATQPKKMLRKSRSKMLSALGSFRSSRRRGNSRFSQPSMNEDSSPQDPSSVEKSAPMFVRSTSLRSVKIFRNKNKISSKSKKPLTEKCSEVSEDSRLERATYSSTVKDSKFPKQVEAEIIDTKESENSSVMKICPYQHCSLHGHHHHHEAPAKRFAFLKRRSGNKREEIKVRQRDELSTLKKASGGRNTSGGNKNDLDFSIEFYARTRSEPVIGLSHDNDDADFADILFSVNSFQDKMNNVFNSGMDAEDSSEIMADKFVSGSVNMELKGKEISAVEVSHSESTNKIRTSNEGFSLTGADEQSKEIEGSFSNDFGEAMDDRSATVSASNSHASEDSLNNKGGKHENYEPCMEPSTNNASFEANADELKKDNHITMWHMIHRHMISGLAGEPAGNKLVKQRDDEKEDTKALPKKKGWGLLTNLSDSNLSDFDKSAENNDDDQEIELRKMFAIKLVREAIEKILLPEVPDDQSVSSEVISDQELSGNNEGSTDSATIPEQKDENNFADVKPTVPKEETHMANDIFTQEKELAKPLIEKRTPNSWSYLKKIILLKRFVKELEKVKKFNPKKPRHLPSEPESEAETVSLRHQSIGDKKNSDEWMLDYALRQVVSELASTQKRKVALLVRAFETVAPSQEDQHMKVTTPKLRNSMVRDSTHQLPVDKTDPIVSSLKTANIIASPKFDISEQLSAMAEENEGESKPEPTVRKLDSRAKDGNERGMEKENHINMWHMIYRHVVTDIASKVGPELLLDGTDGNYWPQVKASDLAHQKIEFTWSDAVKLVQEAVDEILLPEIQDDSSDTNSVASEEDDTALITRRPNDAADDGDRSRVRGVVCVGEEKESGIDQTKEPANEKAVLTIRNKLHPQKSKNWSKLKKLLILKRSIKALENFRKLKPSSPQELPLTSDPEKEKVDLRRQMMDERKKAEQWMLDYAVQHIVTKLTPDRKRRVAMLVEAFEAVIPLPEL